MNNRFEELSEEMNGELSRYLPLFGKALRRFVHNNDIFLINHKVYECTISHRYAIYLQKYFFGWHVDCEYNKIIDDMDNPKLYRVIRTFQEKKVLPNLSKENAILLASQDYELQTDEQEIYLRGAYPDIVIHHRGSTHERDNLFFVEIKIDTGPDPLDQVKLIEFSHGLADEDSVRLKYKYGLFLRFDKPQTTQAGTKGTVRGTLYVDGKSIAEQLLLSYKFDPLIVSCTW